MSKRGRKVLPARKQPDRGDEMSLLIRSAESLGRVIGSLQRQLDGASRRLRDTASNGVTESPSRSRTPRAGDGAKKKKTVARKAAANTSSRKTTATKRAKKR